MGYAKNLYIKKDAVPTIHAQPPVPFTTCSAVAFTSTCSTVTTSSAITATATTTSSLMPICSSPSIPSMSSIPRTVLSLGDDEESYCSDEVTSVNEILHTSSDTPGVTNRTGRARRHHACSLLGEAVSMVDRGTGTCNLVDMQPTGMVSILWSAFCDLQQYYRMPAIYFELDYVGLVPQ